MNQRTVYCHFIQPTYSPSSDGIMPAMNIINAAPTPYLFVCASYSLINKNGLCNKKWRISL
jgi:hypothetical protein